jgi:predicted NBD/HSP70 family sugar kinase
MISRHGETLLDQEEYKRLTDEFNKGCERRTQLHNYASREALEKLIMRSDFSVDEVEQRLKAEDIWSGEIEEHFRTFRKFINEHGIKPS